MTDFPTILFRIPGPHKKPRGLTYAYAGAEDQAQFDALIAKGWSASYEDAAAKLDKKPKAVEIDEVSGPSRAELESKAKELEVSFNWKTSDITLSDRITAALEV